MHADLAGAVAGGTALDNVKRRAGRRQRRRHDELLAPLALQDARAERPLRIQAVFILTSQVRLRGVSRSGR